MPGHITSLEPLRPENAPDDWERAALDAFQRGETERNAFTDIGGKPYLRLMQPMIAKDDIAQVARSCPDVVLLDVEMPGMGGIDVLLSLKAREQTRGISVIMVASHDRDDKVVGALEVGATDFIPKPYSAALAAAPSAESR